jgi:hypothetical protein
VRTDELIERLAADAAPVPGDGVETRLVAAAAVGALGAAGLMLAWLRVRPDLGQAIGQAHFWLKLTYALVLALAGYLMIEKMARPAGDGRRGLVLGLAAVAILVALGGYQLMAAGPDARLAIWMGQSARHCSYNILALSGPMLVAGLLAVRSLAPTRLARAGAATGLFCGGVAMAVYCLHCPETEPAFIATWYSLGAVLTTLAGALLGPLVLRWR